MTEADIRLQIKVRNARILRAMKAAGIANVAELCRRAGCPNHMGAIGDIINFKRRPITKSGEWRPVARVVATALHKEPEALWPEHLVEVEAKKTETFMDVSSEQFGAIAQGEQAVLNKDLVQRLLCKLPPREATVIEMRFGLNGNGEHTLEEVGEVFGRTRDRIRQIQEKAMRRMMSAAKRIA